MTYAGGQVQWAKANMDSRLTVDLEQVMQMTTFNCVKTLYKFCGKVNRQVWGADGWLHVTSSGSHNLIDG